MWAWKCIDKLSICIVIKLFNLRDLIYKVNYRIMYISVVGFFGFELMKNQKQIILYSQSNIYCKFSINRNIIDPDLFIYQLNTSSY